MSNCKLLSAGRRRINLNKLESIIRRDYVMGALRMGKTNHG